MISRFSRLPFLGATTPAVLLVVGGLALGSVHDLAAQEVEERFPGVSLGVTYDTRALPILAIQPFVGATGANEFARLVENVIARDLTNSNRFLVLDELAASFGGDQADYTLWDRLDADWLVTGRMEGEGSAAALVLELHDVVTRRVRDRARFSIPPPPGAEFRMAAHVASDSVVKWVSGEPGFAATRIVFSRPMADGTQDLWIIDADGENLRRLTRHQPSELGYALSLSPAWSPDGTRIAYASFKDAGRPRIYELELGTGRERAIPAPREGDYLTPTYHPDGERIFFGINGGGRSGIYSYNIEEGCCFANLMEGRFEEISPAFSPDGSSLVFNSFRLGGASPQIYLTPATGAVRASILSPYQFGTPGSYTAPEWSPLGNRIAFSGWVDRRGENQILVATLDAQNRVVPPIRRLTTSGVNEDPSWAPDGRHLVFISESSAGFSLQVVDMVTGNRRTLVSGIDLGPPAWSPSLGR